MTSWHYLAMLILVAVIVSALALIETRHENRRVFVELQELEKRRDALEIEWGQLQLEQSAWATHGRIEQLAREQRDMKIPSEAEVMVINRAQH